jgi:hypothetical protein
MRARVKEFNITRHTERIGMFGIVETRPTGVLDVTFGVEMPEKDFALNTKKYKTFDEVDIYLTVRKKPRRKKK